MKHFFCYTILFFLVPAFSHLAAQNITGTWEAALQDEHLLISVEQKGNELCGYTYDYELKNKLDHCIAAFEGRYDRDRKLWFISGKYFIENIGTHILMRIILWEDKEVGIRNLKGMVYVQTGFTSFFGMDGDEIVLKKTSNVPQKLAGGKPECFPKPIVKRKPVAPKNNIPNAISTPITVQPVSPKPLPKSIPPIDTIKKIKPVLIPQAIIKPGTDLMQKMKQRKQVEQSRLEINVKKINLKVYDNAVVDNDTVSIFYNGKLLLSHQRLSEQAIELNIELDENTLVHTITMYAENLGSIPPNTALIVVTAGDKRYELRSKASLEENAVLIFEYKPKE